MKLFAQLTKVGITIFVVLSAIAGYATGFESERSFVWSHFFDLVLGVFVLSSGSLALNQVQEYKLDSLMKRTANRPVASGKITPTAAGLMAFFFIFTGLQLLWEVSELSAYLGLATVLLYNGVYTYYWKPKWIYAAIPGAIPGTLPVTIGYAAVNNNVFSSESIYLFLILFLWQMPHFWALAIKFKDDYREGGIPTLPVALGMEKTLYQMGMYTLAYVGCALASPMFYKTSWFYILLVVPVSLKLLQEYAKFHKSQGKDNWLKFFMWVNVSVLIFLLVPVLDKWNFLFIKSN
ncbi:MAG: heme o synthase [Bdellovibrionaceae bacterium]|nr:heme o synthase [Pseudobdellovibrionaceae bacterium]